MPPRPHAIGCGAQERELQLGQRLGAPAEVRPLVEDAEARARRVDERAVEAAKLGRERRARRRRRRGRSSRRAARAFASSSRARPSCFSTATTSPASCVALPPGAAQRSSVRSPSRAPTASAGEVRAAALRPDPPFGERLLVDARDAVGAGNVRRLAVDLAADEPDDGLARLVLRAHERERGVAPEVALPDLRRPSPGRRA